MMIKQEILTPARGPATVEVRAWNPFELYGSTFAAHRPASGLPGWYVSEVSTGRGVGIGKHPTRQAALTAAREALTRRGEKFVREAVKKALCKQAKEEVKGETT